MLFSQAGCMHACSVTQSCQTLGNPMDCSLPRSSAHGIFQARMLEFIAISYSCVSCIGRQILYHWATWKPLVRMSHRQFRFLANSIWAETGCSFQFSSVSQSCLILCNPMDCTTPGFLVHHQLPKLTQDHVHWVSDAIWPSHPLSSPSPPAFNQTEFFCDQFDPQLLILNHSHVFLILSKSEIGRNWAVVLHIFGLFYL